MLRFAQCLKPLEGFHNYLQNVDKKIGTGV